MDAQYKELYREVQSLRHKVHDLIDDHAHALARTLKDEVQRLEDEIEMNKKPRSLEDRIKSIEQYLEHARRDSQFMDTHHVVMLHDKFKDMRMDLRRLPNY